MSSPAADVPRGPVRADDPPWYTRRVELGLYLAAAASYVVVGSLYKFLLNWIVGPLWVLAWIWLVPAAVERVRTLRARRADRSGPP